MRLSLLVVAASLKQVSAQDDGSGEDVMKCHKLHNVIGDTPAEPYDTCTQTGSWLEGDATTCFFGYDDSALMGEYAGCGQEINCREKYNNALARGHVDNNTTTFCIRNISGVTPIDYSMGHETGSGAAPGSGAGSGMLPGSGENPYGTVPDVHLCCMAITTATAHNDGNLWGDVQGEIGVREISNIIELIFKYNIEGLILSNTSDKNREDLLDTKKNEKGGLSGKPIQAISSKIIKCFYREINKKIPIIGVGGVDSGASAFDKITSGANAIQLYTGMVYNGPGVVSEIKKDLISILKKENLKNIRDAVGINA